MSKPILCIDFDGVIHSYTTPWTNPETISDGPVPGALRWLWKATEWFRVVIYSSRSKTNGGIDAMHNWLRSESLKEFGEDHPMSMMSRDRSSYPLTFQREAGGLSDDRRSRHRFRWPLASARSASTAPLQTLGQKMTESYAKCADSTTTFDPKRQF